MANIPQQLAHISERLKSGEALIFTSPRELVGWFGHYRRTWRQVRAVNTALRACGLYTVPDFEGAGFDDPIAMQLEMNRETGKLTSTDAAIATAVDSDAGSVSNVTEVSASQMPADPVHRVGRFLPASKPVSVARDEALDVAITHMLIHDYSQLPVLQGERSVAGMISWHSIGQCRALGITPTFVRDCIEPHYEVKVDDSIFAAIQVIQEHECVLVRSSDNRIVGILTATDISGSFEQLARPFLLLSYVENHLRALIRPKFSIEELQTAKDPADADRRIGDASDMTFGEYIRLLENRVNWEKLGIAIEASIFVSQLNEVREIRNDVMHFNPEGIEDKDMETLRRVNSFLQSMVAILPKN